VYLFRPANYSKGFDRLLCVIRLESDRDIEVAVDHLARKDDLHLNHVEAENGALRIGYFSTARE